VSHHSSLWRTECAYPLQTRPSPNKQPQALDCCESSQLSLAHGVRLTALPTSPPFLTSHFSLLTSPAPAATQTSASPPAPAPYSPSHPPSLASRACRSPQANRSLRDQPINSRRTSAGNQCAARGTPLNHDWGASYRHYASGHLQNA
jgi:hypothetical protein